MKHLSKRMKTRFESCSIMRSKRPVLPIHFAHLIKQHETGSLEKEFVYELIYTVERKIDHLILSQEKDPEKLKLHLYQACFSDFS